MKKKDEPIYVTQPYLPPLEEFIPFLKKIWDKKILTNGGPFHQELELALCEYLGVENIALFSNGTLALITALQALNIKGEVITTPYSFVATSHSLLWQNCKPVFVDIELETLNIDPAKIEAAITRNTTAIMPVHCYGNPCDVVSIKRIADAHNLRVIYDACHAFGVEDGGGSLLRHGDLSCVSFHATKVFNTFEGGAIICNDLETKKRIDLLKNFGFKNETTVVAPGINGKMSEINAAFGLLQLQYMPEVLQNRELIDSIYRQSLQCVNGIRCLPQYAKKKNYSYFPILIEADYPLTRNALYEKLKENDIHARRYFYPLISDFSMYKDLDLSNTSSLKVATAVAQKVLCLPIYPGLELKQQEKIIEIIAGAVS